MKAFAFSLQRLLEAKEALERAAEEKLAAAQRVLAGEKAKRARLSARAREQIVQIELFSGSTTHRHKLSVHLRYLERVQKRIVIQVGVITRQETLVEELRNRLCAAVRDRKGVEKLRERELSVWQQQQKKEEQKDMDEHAAIGFLHQRSEAVASGLIDRPLVDDS